MSEINLNNIYEIPSNFLDDERLDDALFDKMNENDAPAPHFNHETLQVRRQDQLATPEHIVPLEIDAVWMLRAADRITSNRAIRAQRSDVAQGSRSDYGLAA